MIGLAAVAIVGLSLSCFSPAGETAKPPAPRTFAIQGMMCQGCADTIADALRKIPGVRSADVSLQDKKAVVTADESQVPAEKVLAAVAATGYQARLVSAAQTMKMPAGQVMSMPAGHAMMQPATQPDSSGKQMVLVSITRGKDEVHAVSMRLGLAQSALKDGRQATVFLSVEAPILATKTLGDDVQFADFPPVRQMVSDFIRSGGRVLVCGHCAHVARLTQQDMPDGAKLIGHEELFSAIPPGTVVFSY